MIDYWYQKHLYKSMHTFTEILIEWLQDTSPQYEIQ